MKPLADAQLKELFGSFTYVAKPDGSVKQDPEWIKANIVTLRTVLVPRIMCHTRITRQLASALHKIHLDGLGHLIKTYEGCWVPRKKRWDPKAPLSEHAYGCAIDFNASTNPMGRYNDELEPLAKVFAEFGFAWGGEWKPQKFADPMHFFAYKVWD